uniref:NADH-ubiquinone oxidoreductase chain 2 n=1 Tax=Ariosoma shiroanago TaxID=135220 RepID=D1YU23_ARISH|nr:NADH dehydrogenase subunit 2 [Ariosoma shiroanago]BAI53407.2 NADH dehydrogenase subunit 2 [Ariosoma shiroanago]
MNPYALSMMVMSLGLGTTITFASSHWLYAWLGMEINMLAILPLMMQDQHPRAVEATTKYFLTQATAATLLLFSTMMNAWFTGSWDIQHHPNQLTMTAIFMSLGFKVGLAPMHFWVPEVMQGLNPYTGLVLATWQKLAPMVLIFQISQGMNYSLTIALGLLSALVGSWGALNQTQMRKILAYSSIAHMGWMIIVLKYAPHIMLLTLMIYITLTSVVFLAISVMDTMKLNTLAMAWAKNPMFQISIFISVLSLGGLPPLTGFVPKWLILQEMANQDLTVAATMMLMASVLSLYFYIRISYTTALTIPPNTVNTKTPWRMKTMSVAMPISVAVVLAAMMMPMTPALLAMVK